MNTKPRRAPAVDIIITDEMLAPRTPKSPFMERLDARRLSDILAASPVWARLTLTRPTNG